MPTTVIVLTIIFVLVIAGIAYGCQSD